MKTTISKRNGNAVMQAVRGFCISGAAAIARRHTNEVANIKDWLITNKHNEAMREL